jgi:hypothetical protein
VFWVAVRRLAILIAALAAAAALAAPAGAQAANCKPYKGWKVLAKTSRVVITAEPGYVGTEACYVATGKRSDMFFDTTYAPGGSTAQRRLLRISGRFVAYAFDYSLGEEDNDASGIALLDARKGRYGVLDWVPGEPEASFLYERIVLRGDGVVAWSRPKRILACDTACFKTAVARSGNLEPGDSTVLSSGGAVQPSTLMRDDDRFRWREGSRWRRSAELR